MCETGPERLSAGYVQFEPVFGDIRGNLQRVLSLLEGSDADLLVLPELPFTGYGFQSRSELLSMAEDPGRSTTVDALTDFCARKEIHIVTGFAEKSGDRCYNSALLIGPGGMVSRYRKLHLFRREKECFDPGDLPPAAVRVRDSVIGMMVCFDWAFPEMARTLALDGAEVLCHPSNLVLDLCQGAMVTRCLENRVFAVTANRTGTEERPFGTLSFTGGSQIAAPDGRLLRRASPGNTEVGTAMLETGLARDKNITPENHILSDRRPEFYRLRGSCEQ